MSPTIPVNPSTKIVKISPRKRRKAFNSIEEFWVLFQKTTKKEEKKSVEIP
jgi:hypothetical protein